MKLTKIEDVLIFDREYYLINLNRVIQRYFRDFTWMHLPFWVLTKDNFVKIPRIDVKIENRTNDDILDEIIQICFEQDWIIISFDEDGPSLLKNKGIDFEYERIIKDGEELVNLFGV